MNEKPFWKSKTLQGLFVTTLGIVVVIAARKGWFGIDNKDVENIFEWIGYVAQVLGIPWAGIGRAKSSGEKLTLIAKSKQ